MNGFCLRDKQEIKFFIHLTSSAAACFHFIARINRLQTLRCMFKQCDAETQISTFHHLYIEQKADALSIFSGTFHVFCSILKSFVKQHKMRSELIIDCLIKDVCEKLCKLVQVRDYTNNSFRWVSLTECWLLKRFIVHTFDFELRVMYHLDANVVNLFLLQIRFQVVLDLRLLLTIWSFLTFIKENGQCGQTKSRWQAQLSLVMIIRNWWQNRFFLIMNHIYEVKTFFNMMYCVFYILVYKLLRFYKLDGVSEDYFPELSIFFI